MQVPKKPGNNRKMADKKIGRIAGKLGVGQVSSSAGDEKDMARIREILFGEQSREANNRMARIESLLSAQDTALRELLDMRIERAAKELRDELGSHDRRQATALDALHAELLARLKNTDERLSLLDSDLQDTRYQADHAVDRAQLAALFETMARQLRQTSDE